MRDDQDDGGGDDLAAEQRADLMALQQAAAGAAPAPGAPVQVQEQADQPIPPPSAAAMAAASMLVGVVRPLVEFSVPTLRGAPDALWMPVPEGVAAVVDHYGGGAEWMRHPLARLGMALAPLAAYGAAQAMAKPREGQGSQPGQIAAPAAGQEAAPGSKTVQFGTVMPEGGAS